VTTFNRKCQSFVRGALLAFAAFLSACGGGGGAPSGSPGGNPPGGSPGSVTVSGKITFDRIPFDATVGNGLDPSAIVELPARGIVVEAIRGNSAIASTTTDANGDYSLSVPSDTTIFIRAKAQMLKTDAGAKWNFRVLDNTDGNALYALVSSEFTTANAAITRNLRAPSGLNGGTTYTQTRAAAPFAILDTIYRATELITSASSSAQFEALDIFWSAGNRSTTSQDFCIAQGHIGTTFFTTGGVDETECSGTLKAGIYVLGSIEDTDEFDQHVIGHEFGHYVEVIFGRSDSIGGSHGAGSMLDMRTAFGEGWGNAFAAMVLNDPLYRDSYAGFDSDGVWFDLEEDDKRFADGGWYSETSIGEVLWDAFDAANEAGDTVSLGFAPIFAALERQLRTPALTSIYSFADALRTIAPNDAAGLTTLLQNEQIYGTDAFGSGEQNSGGINAPQSLNVLPVYRVLTPGQPEIVCVRRTAGGEFNELGFYKFFRFSLQNRASVTFTLFGMVDPNFAGSAMARDPDVWVYREGIPVIQSEDGGQTDTTPARQLEPGTYVVEFFDYSFFVEGGSGTRCASVSFNAV
jgi:hypothetical protein